MSRCPKGVTRGSMRMGEEGQEVAGNLYVHGAFIDEVGFRPKINQWILHALKESCCSNLT